MQGKKIAIVVNEDIFFLTHRKNLGLALLKEGWVVYVLTAKTKDEYVEEIEKLGFIFKHIPSERKSDISIKEEYRILSALCKAHKIIKPDLILAVGLKSILWAGLAARKFHISLVSAISGLGFFFIEGRKSLKQKILIFILKYFLPKKKHHIVFQNNEDQNIFIQNKITSLDKTSIIRGMGVDLNEFKTLPFVSKKTVRFLFPARMLKDKGLMEFIAAAKKVEVEHCDVDFILAGSIDDSKNPTGISEKELLGAIQNTKISWIGYQFNMIPTYENADVVVLPSYREGFPKVLIEACAIGRPIITTDVPGCKDCVIDGYNGFIVSAKNEYQLSESMLKFIKDRNLKFSMGKNAHQFAQEKFDCNKINEQFNEIFKAIIL
jgi:glycosyltransferase involved in cell wall biosynthesis